MRRRGVWRHFWADSCFVPYQIAALLAALAWALSSLIAADPVRELGGPRFTRLRMIAVTLILSGAASLFGDWGSLRSVDIVMLSASGLIGLLIGDAALFTAMARIGPRRTGLVFTVNAPFAAIMGVIVFGETFSIVAILGAALTVSGVAIAVGFRRRVTTVRNLSIGEHSFEQVDGKLWIGIAWGIVGALGQAGGALLAKPALDAGVDTITAATTRTVLATIGLWIFARPMDRTAGAESRIRLTWRHVGYLVVSATLAMAIGMSLVLYSLGHGDVGVATILSATTPVILLPLLWITTRRRPTAAAWAGAALTVLGAALLI